MELILRDQLQLETKRLVEAQTAKHPSKHSQVHDPPLLAEGGARCMAHLCRQKEGSALLSSRIAII